MAIIDITSDLARLLVSYDKETGHFFWIGRASYRAVQVKIGHRADRVDTDSGYQRVYINRTPIKAHRLAWLLVTGDWPKGEIDHINGDRKDNRFSNLRDVDKKINRQNKKSPLPGNQSGHIGVAVVRTGRFVACINHSNNGPKESVHLGTFETAEEASRAYEQAKAIYHPGAWVSESYCL